MVGYRADHECCAFRVAGDGLRVRIFRTRSPKLATRNEQNIYHECTGYLNFDDF